MIDLDRRVRRTQAASAYGRGDFRRAFELGRPLAGADRRDRALLEMVGLAAVRIGRAGDAERMLGRALRAAPRRVDLRMALAEAYVQLGRLDDGLEQYDRVLRGSPVPAAALTGKANILHRRGRNQDARSLLAPVVAAGREDAAMAGIFAAVEQSEGRHRESLGLLERHLAADATDPAARGHLHALVAKARERAGDHDGAFAAYAASNRAVERPFDADAFVREIDELIATFSPENLRLLPRASTRSERPVFIASLPRSGSTLVEQIVHSHPDAHGAGEITDIDELVADLPTRLESLQAWPSCLGDWTRRRADELAGAYLRRLRRLGPGAARVTNKHLDNWRHLGLAALLFPGARVVHCRRHPLDNCFSIFMASMNTARYPWATDLARLGLVHRQYERLMAHWREVLDLEILDVEYETLVADPEPGIRRLIDFCGLPWDERCLRFHEARRDVLTLSYDQVNRPIYRSAVRRYEKYDRHLAPLKAALAG